MTRSMRCCFASKVLLLTKVKCTQNKWTELNHPLKSSKTHWMRNPSSFSLRQVAVYAAALTPEELAKELLEFNKRLKKENAELKCHVHLLEEDLHRSNTSLEQSATIAERQERDRMAEQCARLEGELSELRAVLQVK